MPATVAVLGLGTMGTGIAHTLATAGYEVMGVDPAPEARDRTGDAIPVVDLDHAVRRCATLILSLPGSPQVEDVLLGPGGLLASATEHRLVVDTSTCDPLSTTKVAESLTSRGHSYVDAPVSGGAQGAANGTLTAFVGGHDDAVAEADDVLGVIARHVTRVGGPGAGHLAKLVNNMLCATHLQIAGEVLRLGQAAGVDAGRLVDAVNTASGRSAVTEVNLPRWVLSQSFDSGFTLGLMARDVALTADIAHALGVETPLAEDVARAWQETRDRLGAAEDFNRMAQP
ncbi:NAD(P)-dependent oxidoreductase [Actinobacteria bacterium YIM 96077]|uniref:NAD(P)-dependent oxidoreductase n=1 Tax=Phytoactinopolyspora halophila TaxID=1981511 RepID=A0A329R3P0_9ACTN|nr:NAD(P)-dependent oxidoreductase [Phytoactinopolyspora halophila]AYY12116.1 NAD(P)-dependent oxidoreductase [Actinobacteria bacterium YIM 96077]RAW18649.1 NAD(P)-dependent oxidoreductase [Phytoactinopolyspora halophila]